VLVPRYLGRLGNILLVVASSLLFLRAAQLIAVGIPGRLRRFPRVLAYAELIADGIAAASGWWVWVWQPFAASRRGAERREPNGAAAQRLNQISVITTFALHAARMAIYVSPGQGRRDTTGEPGRTSDGTTSKPREIAAGVYWLPVRGTNVYFVRSGATWVLIDTAWAHCAQPILQAADALFGPNARPAAILLTHAHPDHAGSARDLASQWCCPVYVHPDELAIATARDLATVEKYGNPLDRWLILPLMRAIGPRRAEAMLAQSTLAGVARPFDPNGVVPGLPDWTYVATPGHSPGHVAFFREGDHVLITGDAVLTIDLNSVQGLLSSVFGENRQCVASPPWYTNWNQSVTAASFAVLASREPRVLAPGHGTPMTGAETTSALRVFADRYSHPAAANCRETTAVTARPTS
jgi:glyoxylase-like metal-dependent hydrolase (beta-lactamase superfamily II)